MSPFKPVHLSSALKTLADMDSLFIQMATRTLNTRSSNVITGKEEKERESFGVRADMADSACLAAVSLFVSKLFKV